MGKLINSKNKNLKTILVTTAVIVAGVFIFFNFGYLNNQSNISLNESQHTKTFQSSDVMDFSIIVPADYEVIEKLGSANIIADGENNILIGRNGTNFNNLDDYIKNSRNNLEPRLLKRESMIINGLETVSGVVNNEKIYFIYAQNVVYTLSTENESLFDDLDQIAQSFRYTGE